MRVRTCRSGLLMSVAYVGHSLRGAHRHTIWSSSNYFKSATGLSMAMPTLCWLQQHLLLQKVTKIWSAGAQGSCE